MSTTIKIGHASISEHGTASGAAGDSTGREVWVVDNYNIASKKYNVVLRPKTLSIANKSVEACIAGCENNHIGYSQNGRNTLYNVAKNVNFDLAKINTDCNTDCSAFMTVCAIAAGAKINYGTNAPTTTSMRAKFKQSGDYTVLTDTKHTTMTDYLKRGDILVCEGSHTIMILENGSQYADEQIEVVEIEDLTPTRTIHTYDIKISVTNITSNKATITAKFVEYLNNIETSSSLSNSISFRIVIQNMTNGQSVTKSITDSLTLSLLENTTYKIYVEALKNKSNTVFCVSAPAIFTTAQSPSKKEIIKYNKQDMGPYKLIRQVYIKDKNNNFKPAATYLNN